jgi:hypothetical protein
VPAPRLPALVSKGTPKYDIGKYTLITSLDPTTLSQISITRVLFKLQPSLVRRRQRRGARFSGLKRLRFISSRVVIFVWSAFAPPPRRSPGRRIPTGRA